MSKPAIFLDVDSSIVENNLRITNDDDDENDFNKYLKGPVPPFPSKLIKPSPGFCVKTREVGTDTKLFVNICTTDAIPAPKDITEDELNRLLNSDEITDYRIGMSIAELRTELDKKGEEAKACDVAINADYFKKIESSQLFRGFTVSVVIEGIENKFNIKTVDEKIILKNRKAYGTLQMHRIQQREVRKLTETETNKPKIEVISASDDIIVPDYRVFQKDNDKKNVYAQVLLKNVVSSNEVTVDVGEDRFIVESKLKKYLLDLYLPFVIDQANVKSYFQNHSKILTIRMPIL